MEERDNMDKIFGADDIIEGKTYVSIMKLLTMATKMNGI